MKRLLASLGVIGLVAVSGACSSVTYVEAPSMLGSYGVTNMGGGESQVAEVRGMLDSKDAMNNRGAYADHYAFSGSAGEPIEVNLSSNDFDAYLLLYDAAGYVIAENDYGGYDYVDAHLNVTLPADAQYMVVATSYSLAQGAYELVVTRRPLGTLVPVLDVGGSATRRFSSFDSFDYSGNPYHVYGLQLTAGVQVSISMGSADMDSLVHLYDPQGWEVGMDDDSGGDYNSLLYYVPPATATYYLVATTFSPPSTYLNPSYDLSVE